MPDIVQVKIVKAKVKALSMGDCLHDLIIGGFFFFFFKEDAKLLL